MQINDRKVFLESSLDSTNIKKKTMRAGWWKRMLSILALRIKGQVDFCESETRSAYNVSFRTSRATQ